MRLSSDTPIGVWVLGMRCQWKGPAQWFTFSILLWVQNQKQNIKQSTFITSVSKSTKFVLWVTPHQTQEVNALHHALLHICSLVSREKVMIDRGKKLPKVFLPYLRPAGGTSHQLPFRTTLPSRRSSISGLINCGLGKFAHKLLCWNN